MLVGVMTLQEAEDLVRFCLGEGEVISGRHFREELAKEGIVFEDAWVVLRTGRIYDPPEQDIKTGEWKYRMEGYEPGGKWMVIALSFKTIQRTFLITIFSVEARGKKP